MLITSFVTLTKLKAAILKFNTPAIITLSKVIIVRCDAFFDLSEYAHLFSHQSESNYIKTPH